MDYIIIPAYNESQSLPSLLGRLRRNHNISILVIDDGSTDDTPLIIKKHRVALLRNTKNIGVGKSILRALRHVRKKSFRAIILMDADGQHDPSYIPKLLLEIRRGADVVIASRYIQQSPAVTSRIRQVGTSVISWWLRVWFRKNIRDPTSGFRALSPHAVQQLSNIYPKYFPEPAVVVEAVTHGLVMCEIPCAMKPRKYGTSSISLGKSIMLMIYILMLIPFRSVKNAFNNIAGYHQLS